MNNYERKQLEFETKQLLKNKQYVMQMSKHTFQICID